MGAGCPRRRGFPVELRDFTPGWWSESTVSPAPRPRDWCARVRTGKPGRVATLPGMEGSLIRSLGNRGPPASGIGKPGVYHGGQRVLTAVPAHVKSPGQSLGKPERSQAGNLSRVELAASGLPQSPPSVVGLSAAHSPCAVWAVGHPVSRQVWQGGHQCGDPSVWGAPGALEAPTTALLPDAESKLLGSSDGLDFLE